MSPAKKRILFAVMVVVLLLTACGSAPVATEDPEIGQIEQTVEALAGQNEPPNAQKPTNASPTLSPAAVEQPGNPTVDNVPSTQTPDPASVSLQETLDAFSAELETEGRDLAEQAAQATETNQQLATESVGTSEAELSGIDIINTVPHPEFPTLGAAEQTLEECVVRIRQENSRPKSFSLPKPRVRLVLEPGNEIIILQPVNLRSGPTLRHRILMVLRPDPVTSSRVTPAPGVTPPSATVYKIIGGPAYTNIGDETKENANFSVQGRKYIWWQIELPNQRIGWLVEASACGQIQFIEKVN